MKNEKLPYSEPALNVFQFDVYSIMQDTSSAPAGGGEGLASDDYE